MPAAPNGRRLLLAVYVGSLVCLGCAAASAVPTRVGGILLCTQEKGAIRLDVMNDDGTGAARLENVEKSLTEAGARYCGNVVPSRDGQIFGVDTDAGLFVARADGSLPLRVARPAYGFDFAPNGREIAYVGGRLGNPQLYRVGVNGNGRKMLTSSRRDDTDPHWSPNGREILFVRFENANLVGTQLSPDGGVVRTVDRAGKRTRLILPFSSDSPVNPQWSPNGRSIAVSFFHDYSGIAVVAAAGSRRPLRQHDSRWVYGGSVHGDLAWAADGRHLFATDYYRGVLLSFRPNGSNQRTIWRTRLEAWSPIAGKIALISCPQAGCGVYSIRADGTQLRKLLAFSGQDCKDGCWIRTIH
jgi:WD40-like Beta Propeller Repeat